MASIPEYLWVQFARFGYKQASSVGGTDATKVKHVRKLAFSPNLDIYDYASPELQEVLKLGRLKLREKREEETEAARKQIADFGKTEEELKAEADSRNEGVEVVVETGRSEKLFCSGPYVD